MRLEKLYYFIFFIILLSAVVNALTEEIIEIVKAAEPEINPTTLSSDMMVKKMNETTPAEDLIDAVAQSQGHENVGERKARQFGFPGFGYRPFLPRPNYGGGFGGGFGGGGFGGGGFQRTRVVTRTRVVERVRGGRFGGGGFYGGGFYG